MRRDPVIAAVLREAGTDFEGLRWAKSCLTPHSTGISARLDGLRQADLRQYEDSEDWVATVQIDPLVSYHAQRGHRSVTLRRPLPESTMATLGGRRADNVVDAPGFDEMTIVEATVSGGYTTLILQPTYASTEEVDG